MKNHALVILMGPSGVGKSSITKRLLEKSPDFVLIPVVSDRRPRSSGNFGRELVSPDTFSKMIDSGEFLAWHTIYGNRYAIPKKPVLDALTSGKIPIHDYPEEIVSDIRGKVPTHAIYIMPPSLDVLSERLGKDERNDDGKRLEAAKEELVRLEKQGFKNENIDFVITNHNIDDAVEEILSSINSV